MDCFLALADPTRRRIVETLAKGPMASGEIAGLFHVTPSAISQHLKALRSAKLVRVRAQAQRRIYELDQDGFGELEIWISELKEFWTRRFDSLETALRK